MGKKDDKKRSRKRAEKEEEDDDYDNDRKTKEEVDEDEEAEDDGGATKKKRRKRKRKRAKKDAAADGEDDDSNNNNRDTLAAHEDDTDRTVFVEGVPYDATPEQVAECLVSYTKINRDDIMELRFPTWQDSGRMRGYGHVVFTTTQITKKVLKVAESGTKLWVQNRYLSIQPAKPKSGPAPPPVDAHKNPTKTLLLKNLDYNASEDDIQQVMEQFGSIIDGGVRIARNFQTRQNKGFAYVEYEDVASAEQAMQQQLNKKPVYILKRACWLDYDEGRMKGSYKTSSGRLWTKEYKGSSSNDGSGSRN